MTPEDVAEAFEAVVRTLPDERKSLLRYVFRDPTGEDPDAACQRAAFVINSILRAASRRHPRTTGEASYVSSDDRIAQLDFTNDEAHGLLAAALTRPCRTGSIRC
jgi:hypothetical protein